MYKIEKNVGKDSNGFDIVIKVKMFSIDLEYNLAVIHYYKERFFNGVSIDPKPELMSMPIEESDSYSTGVEGEEDHQLHSMIDYIVSGISEFENTIGFILEEKYKQGVI